MCACVCLCVCFYVIHFINQWLRKQNTIVFAGKIRTEFLTVGHVQKQDLSEYVLILLFTWCAPVSPCSMKRRFSSKSNVATVDLYRNDRPLILIMFGILRTKSSQWSMCCVNEYLFEIHRSADGIRKMPSHSSTPTTTNS